MTAPTVCRVDPDAAAAWLELAAGAIRRLTAELSHAAPATRQALQALGDSVDGILRRGRLDGTEVEIARRRLECARYCGLENAFRQLNPGFGVIHNHGWAWGPDALIRLEAKYQRRAQRHELELSMGERFAAMLPPLGDEGGEAP